MLAICNKYNVIDWFLLHNNFEWNIEMCIECYKNRNMSLDVWQIDESTPAHGINVFSISTSMHLQALVLVSVVGIQMIFILIWIELVQRDWFL